MAVTTGRSSQLVNYLLLLLLGLVSLLLLADLGRQLVISQQRHGQLLEEEENLQATMEQEAALEERLKYSRSHSAAEAWGRTLGWTRADTRIEAASPVLSENVTPQRISSRRPRTRTRRQDIPASRQSIGSGPAIQPRKMLWPGGAATATDRPPPAPVERNGTGHQAWWAMSYHLAMSVPAHSP